MDLIDIGVNLTSKQFRSDVDDVVERARAAGVVRMIATGTSLEASRRARALAERRPGVLWSTAGVHPHDAKHLDRAQLDELSVLCRAPEVVAVGECGLDYNRNFSPPADQRVAFERQLELAATAQKPVFLHERDAHDDFVRILANARAHLVGMVVHCFTGSVAEAAAYVELGAYLGITGWICDERRGQALREAVGVVPADRLLVETDAPFLLPRDLKPKPTSRRNEPCHLPHVVRAIARCRGEEPEAIGARSWQNASTLFGLDAAGASLEAAPTG